jgi:hypothetical protein
MKKTFVTIKFLRFLRISKYFLETGSKIKILKFPRLPIRDIEISILDKTAPFALLINHKKKKGDINAALLSFLNKIIPFKSITG